MKYRGALIHPQELDKVWIDDMHKLGLNVIGLHPVGGKRADESLNGLLGMREQIAPLLDYARGLGLSVEYEMHALSKLLPKTEFEKHPDWFRLDSTGARRPDFNMCCSNGEALAYVEESAYQLTLALPSDTHRYYYWLDDVVNNWCSCEKCRELSTSDQQTVILNAILKGVRRADPSGKLAWLSYLDTLIPPKKVKPDAGLFLEFAPIRRSLEHSLWDKRVKKNRGEIAFLGDMLKVFDVGDAKVLEYWTDNSLLSRWTKPPKRYALRPEVMEKDVREYVKLGFENITAFACYLGADYRELYGMPELSEYGRILNKY